MAVRDVDDIIGAEKLKKIAEKKEQDKLALNAINMLYRSRIEEQNRRNAERFEKPKVPDAQISDENLSEETVSNNEFDFEFDEFEEEPLVETEEVLEEFKEDLKPSSEKLEAISEETAKELNRKKKRIKKEEDKLISGISKIFNEKISLNKIKNSFSKEPKQRKSLADYENEQICKELNHKKDTLTEAEKEKIRNYRISAGKNYKVKRATKSFLKERSKFEKALPVIIVAIMFTLFAAYSGLLASSYKNNQSVEVSTSGFLDSPVVQNTDLNPFTAYFQALSEGTKLTLSGFDSSYFFTIFGILMGIGAAAGLLIWSSYDDKKRMRVGHEHGRVRLANKHDVNFFKKRFMDKNPKNNIIFSRDIGLSLDNTFAGRTSNVLIIGGTGTGKTFKYVKPNILQQNCSMIITDPSGDIFDSFSGYLLDKGYNVYIFNVKDLELSNYYNPLLNVFNAKGEIDEVKVDILVDLYMKNAKNGQEQGSQDPFWDKSEKAFLTALVYYVLENDDIEPVDKCFNTILKKAQDAKAETENGKKKEETKLTAEIKSWENEMKKKGRKIKTPDYYATFLIAPDKTANTILITTAVDLQLFATKEVDRITRVNEQYPDFNIDFDTIAQIQSYVFLCIPQQHQAYNFLISMFYSQLYGRLYEYGEKIARNQYFIEAEWGIPLFKGFDSHEEAEAFRVGVTKDDIIEVDYINGTKIYKVAWGEGYNKKVYRSCFNKDALIQLIDSLGETKVMRQADMFHGDPALPIHCNFLLDEFKNIGEIPNFLTTLSTSRKYRIGSHVIIQDIGQIKTMYKEEEHQTLLANCDTLIFLGSLLTDDKKYIQETLGKTTIKVKSVSDSKTGKSTSYTPTEVDLMSLDEISAINDEQSHRDDCIIIIRDYMAFVNRKYFLFDHPKWKEVLDYKEKSKKSGFNPNMYYLNNAESEIYNI